MRLRHPRSWRKCCPRRWRDMNVRCECSNGREKLKQRRAQSFLPCLRAMLQRKLTWQSLPKTAKFPKFALSPGAAADLRTPRCRSPLADRHSSLPKSIASETQSSDLKQPLALVVFFCDSRGKDAHAAERVAALQVKRGSAGKIACLRRARLCHDGFIRCELDEAAALRYRLRFC